MEWITSTRCVCCCVFVVFDFRWTWSTNTVSLSCDLRRLERACSLHFTLSITQILSTFSFSRLTWLDQAKTTHRPEHDVVDMDVRMKKWTFRTNFYNVLLCWFLLVCFVPVVGLCRPKRAFTHALTQIDSTHSLSNALNFSISLFTLTLVSVNQLNFCLFWALDHVRTKIEMSDPFLAMVIIRIANSK